jgi:hypothetical protein
MTDKSESSQAVKIIGSIVLAIIVIAMSFAMGWYGKELSVINQRQLELRQQIAAVQMDMEQSVSSVAESVEQIRLEFEDVTDGIQKDISQIHNTIDAVRREQNEIQNNTQNRIQEIKGNTDTMRQNQLQTKNLAEQTAQEQMQSRKMLEDASNSIQELRELIDALNQRIENLSNTTAEQDPQKKPKPENTVGGNDVTNANRPDVKPDWQDQYVVNLESIDSIDERFHVDWYRPHKAGNCDKQPDSIKILPKFRYETQKYFFIQLGNTQDNHIACIADFTKHEIGPASFDLYVDKDRDGDLAEDFVTDCKNITGIQIPFKDGTMENYSLNLYPLSCMHQFFYRTLSGRYGTIETNTGKIPVLVMDNNGNGIFSDTEDLILLDWNMDGELNGSGAANEDCPLYSVLNFAGASYRVAQIDEPGRSLTLKRQPETAAK